MTMFKRKNEKKSSSNEFIPGYGSAPYKRAFVASIIMLAISFIMSFLSIKDILFMPPIEMAKPENATKWLILELFIPYTILYFSSFFTGLAILSMQGFKYIKWLFKQAISPVMINYLFMFLIIVSISAINVYINIRIPQLENSELNPMEKSLWLSILIMYTVPLWMGYKTSWKLYRELGTKTMQDRYEEKLEKLELKNSGQFWDKYVTKIFNKSLGLDGGKPRGGFLYIILVTPFLMVLYGIAVSIGVFFNAISVYFIAPSILFVIMATSKYKDVKNMKREPFLLAIRYPDTVDSLDRKSKGIQRFDRY